MRQIDCPGIGYSGMPTFRPKEICRGAFVGRTPDEGAVRAIAASAVSVLLVGRPN